MVIIISSMEEGSREGEQGREEGEQEEREGSLVCLGMVTQVVRDSSMAASSLILPGRLSVQDWQMGLTGRPYIALSQLTESVWGQGSITSMWRKANVFV